jgi:prepilin-type N-terminal cleavage/methylation domain-containing protein
VCVAAAATAGTVGSMTSATALVERRRTTAAFTLVELILVLAVLGLIASIVFSSMSSSRRGHREAMAAVTLNEAVLAQVTFAGTYGTYTGWPADLDLPGDLRATARPSTGPNEVSLALGVDGSVGIAVKVDDGRRCLARRLSSFSAQGPSATMVDLGDDALCSGVSALPEGEAASPVTGSARP